MPDDIPSKIKDLHQKCDLVFADLVKVKQEFAVADGLIQSQKLFSKDKDVPIRVDKYAKGQVNHVDAFSTLDSIHERKPEWDLNDDKDIYDAIGKTWDKIKDVKEICGPVYKRNTDLSNVSEDIHSALIKAEKSFMELLKVINERVNGYRWT